MRGLIGIKRSGLLRPGAILRSLADKLVMHARVQHRNQPEVTCTETALRADDSSVPGFYREDCDVIDPYTYYDEPDDTVRWQLRLIFESIAA